MAIKHGYSPSGHTNVESTSDSNVDSMLKNRSDLKIEMMLKFDVESTFQVQRWNDLEIRLKIGWMLVETRLNVGWPKVETWLNVRWIYVQWWLIGGWM